MESPYFSSFNFFHNFCKFIRISASLTAIWHTDLRLAAPLSANTSSFCHFPPGRTFFTKYAAYYKKHSFLPKVTRLFPEKEQSNHRSYPPVLPVDKAMHATQNQYAIVNNVSKDLLDLQLPWQRRWFCYIDRNNLYRQFALIIVFKL